MRYGLDDAGKDLLDSDLGKSGASNDRLLLGLKGTMSDAELHVLRARLRGGILNQARCGALGPGEQMHISGRLRFAGNGR